MASQPSIGAALQFTQEELGGPCTENESYPVCQTTSTVIAQGNGDRVGLIVMNLGSNPINLSLQGIPSATGGILLAGNGGVLGMTVRDDFTLPARQWNAIATGGTSQMYVLEIIRYSTNQVGVS